MSIKTIKGRRRLWYEHMKGSITPLIKWAHLGKKKRKSKAVERRATNTAISHFYSNKKGIDVEMLWACFVHDRLIK